MEQKNGIKGKHFANTKILKHTRFITHFPDNPGWPVPECLHSGFCWS